MMSNIVRVYNIGSLCIWRLLSTDVLGRGARWVVPQFAEIVVGITASQPSILCTLGLQVDQSRYYLLTV